MSSKPQAMIAVLRLALTTAIVTMLSPPAFAQTVEAAPDPCIAGEPCFTNVSDILNGRRHLLRTDDLAFAGQFRGAGKGTAFQQTGRSDAIKVRCPKQRDKGR